MIALVFVVNKTLEGESPLASTEATLICGGSVTSVSGSDKSSPKAMPTMAVMFISGPYTSIGKSISQPKFFISLEKYCTYYEPFLKLLYK
jgi:hypothetical protein